MTFEWISSARHDIIFGSTALGVAGTLVIEHSIELPAGFAETLALTIGIVSGFIGCFVAGAWNYWGSGGKARDTKSDKTVV